jgi:hypothetical protein
MDLSKFSTEDLEALQAGDLSRVSTEALEMLQGKKPKATFGDALKREVMSSLPVATVRGLKDIVDTGAEFVSRLGGRDEQARVRAMNEAGKAEFAQATEGRIAPQIARIGGNVLGTLPVVSGIGSLVSMAAPRLGAAISSGGMTTGAAPTGALARLGDMGIRVAGGAAGGGVAAARSTDVAKRGAQALRALATPRLDLLMQAESAVELAARRSGIDWAAVAPRAKQQLRDEVAEAMSTGKPLDADALRRLIVFRQTRTTPTVGMLTQIPVTITRTKQTGANWTPAVSNSTAAERHLGWACGRRGQERPRHWRAE